MPEPTRVSVSIDLNALSHNFEIVKKASPAKVIAMVKGNAYGHGLIHVAKTLTKADAFGVADLAEAMHLRETGISQKIILLTGFLSKEEMQALVKYKIDSVVHTVEQVKELENNTLSSSINVWIKIDTGMHRLGFPLNEVDAVYERLNRCKAVGNIYFMSHLADADAISKPTTSSQIDCFKEAVKKYQNEKSLANSAGILTWPESHFDWVRPGIMLYGTSPMLNKTGREHQLKPVMTLQSRLIAIHQFQKGDRIGYGGTWQCQASMPIGVVSIGYADGYPRHAKNGTPVLINDTICPLVGRVSMDFITVDLRLNPTAMVGDVVTLWGKGLPIEKVAESSDTIGYELTTRISPRLTQQILQN